MRNLKRALSLALASVMLLGMMVVGTSAASYTDVDENDNVEAIEVLNAVNVMIGRQGNFEPDEAVNRHEMAVIMAKLYLGVEAADSYVGSHPFTDVVPWADKYVAACYENGLVAGTSATTYGGGNPLTAVQAAAMMLRALGYVDLSKGAANWSTPVTAKANEIRLFSNVASNPKAQLTRNQVAQLALNTLQSTMVTAKGGNDIQIGDVTIPDEIEYTVRIAEKSSVGTAIDTKYQNGTAATGAYGYTLELGEHLYNGKLRKTSVSDGFQAPATRWSYNNTEIGTYTDDADYVFEGTVKSSAMYAAVGKTVADNYAWEVYMDGQTDNLNDGDKPLFTQADVKGNNSDSLNGTGNGTVTYVYLDNTATGNYSGTATVTILNTYAAEISKVKDGKITLDGERKTLETEATGYGEGDVALYTQYYDGSWKLGTLLGKAELVEAEADTVRAGKFVKIGDKTYNYNTQFNSTNGDKLAETYAGQDVALYLDGQGNIVYLGDAKEGTDYALVMGVGRSAQYNEKKPLYGAELMLSDGTYKNVLLDKDLTDSIIYADDISKWSRAGDADDSGKTDPDDANLVKIQQCLVGKVFAFTEDKSGSFDLTAKVGQTDRTVNVGYGIEGKGFKEEGVFPSDKKESKADDKEEKVELPGRPSKTELKDAKISTSAILKTGKASAALGDFVASENSLRFDNDTVFVLNDKTDGEFDFTVYTGYKNVPDVKLTEYSTVSAYKNANGVTRVVFITNASIDTAKDVVFIVGDAGAKEEKTGGTTYKSYKAVVKGEVTTVRAKGDALETIESLEDNIGVFAGITFNADGYATKLKGIDETEKMKVNGEQSDWKAYVGTNTEKKGVYSFDRSEDKNGVVTWAEGYATNDKVVIVYYGEYNGSNDTLHIETRLDNDKNDEAYVVTDDGDVVAIFVVEVKGEETEEKLPDFSIDEVNFTINITSTETMTAAQIRQAIAEFLDVATEDVEYTPKNNTATAGGITYDVTFNKVGTKEEVAGAELANKIENSVKTPYAPVTVEGNTVKVDATEVADYGTAKEGNVTKATADLARFLAALHDEGVKEIKYGEKTYTWDPEAGVDKDKKPNGYTSKWVEEKTEEAGKAKATESAEKEETGTLVEAIAKSLTESWKKGECNFTIYADKKPINFSITVPKGSL